MNCDSQPSRDPITPTKNVAETIVKKQPTISAPVKPTAPAKPVEKPLEEKEKTIEPTDNSATKPKKTDTPLEMDWDKVVEKAKEKSLGLSSLLQKSQWAFDGEKLTVYAGTAFYKKKLDDAKNRPLIAEIITEETGMELEIDIIGERKPPEDKKLAEIAELMGGGEEVKLEDI